MMRSSPLRLKELFFPQVSVKALVPPAPEKAARELNLEDLDISFGLDVDDGGKTAKAGLKIASKNTAADTADKPGPERPAVDRDQPPGRGRGHPPDGRWGPGRLAADELGAYC